MGVHFYFFVVLRPTTFLGGRKMEDPYAGLGHLMTIGLMFLVFGIILAIVGGITGKDPDELMAPKSSVVAEEATEDPDLVPIELVRKMYYYADSYWVDVDGVAVEIEPSSEGTGLFYFKRRCT